MTQHESHSKAFQELNEKLARLVAGVSTDELIDDAFIDTLLQWLGPIEPMPPESLQFAVTQLRTVMTVASSDQMAQRTDAAFESVERSMTTPALVLASGIVGL